MKNWSGHRASQRSNKAEKTEQQYKPQASERKKKKHA